MLSHTTTVSASSRLSRILGAEVRLNAARFDFGIRPSWERTMENVRRAGDKPFPIELAVRSTDLAGCFVGSDDVQCVRWRTTQPNPLNKFTQYAGQRLATCIRIVMLGLVVDRARTQSDQTRNSQCLRT